MIDRNNPEVALRRTPSGWSPDTYTKMPWLDALNKMIKLGYKAVRTRTIGNMRYLYYENPKRKTYYTIILDIRDFWR